MPQTRPRSVWMTYRVDENETLHIGAPYSGEQTARRSLDDLPDGWRPVEVPFDTNVADAVAAARSRKTREVEQPELPADVTDAVVEPAKRSRSRRTQAEKDAAKNAQEPTS